MDAAVSVTLLGYHRLISAVILFLRDMSSHLKRAKLIDIQMNMIIIRKYSRLDIICSYNLRCFSFLC